MPRNTWNSWRAAPDATRTNRVNRYIRRTAASQGGDNRYDLPRELTVRGR